MHCKAGLGRTGTLIALYLMKHHSLTYTELIGWLRLCRPGSVIGPQQNFLADMEKRMWREGEAHRTRGPGSHTSSPAAGRPPAASVMSTAMKGLSVSGSGSRSGSAHSSPNASPNPMRPPRASEQARAGTLPTRAGAISPLKQKANALLGRKSP